MESQERIKKIEELRGWIAEHSEKKDVSPEYLEAAKLTCTLMEEEENLISLEPDFDEIEEYDREEESDPDIFSLCATAQ